MRAHHIYSFPITFSFVSADHVGHNIGLLLEGFAALAGGDFFGAPITLRTLPVLILGVLTICAAGIVMAYIWRGMRSVVWAPDRPLAGRVAYFSFWSTCSLVALAPKWRRRRRLRRLRLRRLRRRKPARTAA